MSEARTVTTNENYNRVSVHRTCHSLGLNSIKSNISICCHQSHRFLEANQHTKSELQRHVTRLTCHTTPNIPRTQTTGSARSQWSHVINKSMQVAALSQKLPHAAHHTHTAQKVTHHTRVTWPATLSAQNAYSCACSPFHSASLFFAAAS